VCDVHDACDIGLAEVEIENVAPTIDAITAPVDPVDINGQPVSVEVAFSDPGTPDTHDVTWDWGDDSEPDTQSGVTSPAPQGHTYDLPGVYAVTVTVEDDDGGTATATYEYIVIYDPAGGFVTGGGWIYSPAGAYVPDPEAEGKANFGFVSKYKKGADTPTGQTEFQFKAGDLNFHSSSYDWLVIAGARAKYKGVGTINGGGNYGFMLTATDAALTPNTDVDLFRIKIWDRDTDVVVYDNQMGEDDDGYAGTEIGGGNITTHTAT
jgi:PKD repeat protein